MFVRVRLNPTSAVMALVNMTRDGKVLLQELRQIDGDVPPHDDLIAGTYPDVKTLRHAVLDRLRGAKVETVKPVEAVKLVTVKPDVARHNPDPCYVRELLDMAGLSQVRAAKLLGITDRVMRRYCADSSTDAYHPIPYPVQFCLECLAGISD